MGETCPISYKLVDEKVVRINSILTAITVLSFFITSNKFVIVFLSVDFFIRGFIDPVYSPYSMLSKSLLRFSNNKPKLIDGSPKIFAAKLGFVFSSTIVLFAILNYHMIPIVIGILLILFALLEGIFGYCVGCKIYAIIEKYKKTQHN